MWDLFWYEINVMCNQHLPLFILFSATSWSGKVGRVEEEFENRDAHRASREQAPWRRRMSVFVCLFVVCSGRFVAASVRYLTLLVSQPSRFPSAGETHTLSISLYLLPPFFLDSPSSFPFSRIDPCKFTRPRRSRVTSGIFTIFPRS